ncbi:MAG: hypothetical protein R3E79_46730 [Caldilineaceae bacterium]
MKHKLTELEQRRLAELARDYRNQGYTVITEPTKEQLPAFLASFQPDMLAYNTQENVVFLVRSQSTLTASPELAGIAKTVEGQPGWRFDLVVTNTRPKAGFATATDQLLNRTQVMTRLQESDELSTQEHGEAAFLLAWSAAEAVLRTVAGREKVAPVRSSSEAVAKNLYAHGLLDREQYETLREGLNVRNAIVHGYQEPPAYAYVLHKLQALTRQLLNEEALVRIY